jgi:hypothetical protein
MNGQVNGESISIDRKKTLITRNLQEVLGEDRLDTLMKERDIRVSENYNVINQ